MAQGTNLGLRVCAALTLMLISLAALVVSPKIEARIVNLPPGFSEALVANNIQNPVGMEISPDGRLFIMAGNLRRIEIFDDTGFLNEFIRLPQVANLGSGLLGLEFSPDFLQTGDVYVAYVTETDAVSGTHFFRLSKFSSNGTSANPDSEEILFEIEDVNPGQQLHQGGDLVIGNDNKIYWALGDRVRGSVVSQPFDSLFGKLLRLNLDGTIPADNPFYSTLQGDFRAIYANGLRNPFRMDLHRSTGGIFMSEVGNTNWEEINQVEESANYGWPIVEGFGFNPAYTDPVFAYPHIENALPNELFGCAITGGSFYEPSVNQFPARFRDKFFYADHCFGWIAYLDVETGIETEFATGASRLIEVKVHPQSGALYYLDREYAGDRTGPRGGIGRIEFEDNIIELEITNQPESAEAGSNETVTFEVFVTGETPITFQWYRDNLLLPGETDSALTLSQVTTDDHNAEFFVVVTDAFGISKQSETATLTISANNAPAPNITLPELSLLYTAGEEYSFAGTATDVEDGELDASAFEWRIVFHHDDHVHPFIPEILNTKTGSFVPETSNETEPSVWYRIHLTVTDSAGASQTVQRDVFPLLSNVTVETNPPGLVTLIDGTEQTGSAEFDGVAGILRVLEAPATQDINGETWTFDSWSNGGDRTQTIATPSRDTTYVANYNPPDGSPNLLPVAGLATPTANTIVSAPLTISGTATDIIGVNRVLITIRETGTTNHWNGSSFQAGWRTVEAVVEDPFALETNWSYVFTPPEDIDVTIVAQARRVGGQGEKERIDVSVIAETETPPVTPSIQVDSPEHRSEYAGLFTFSGTAELENLSEVKVVIKDFRSPIYWNGVDWQSSRIELDATLIGNSWSYVFQPEIPRDVSLRAIATNGTLRDNPDRLRIFSERITVFAEQR